MSQTNGTHVKTEQINPAAMLPEAPASATAKMTSPAGIEWMVTVRDLSASGLLNKINRLESELLGTGWTPANGANAGQRVGDASGAPVCPVHRTPMKKSKFNGWYCTQRDAAGNYCKEEVKG